VNVNELIVKTMYGARITTKLYLLFIVLTITGCAGGIKIPHLSVADYETKISGSERVVVSKVSPENGAKNKGSIIGVHGNGCGLMGFKGDRDGAIIALKNKAVRMGASYVLILKEQGPYSDGKCAHNEYKIEGNAYAIIPPEEQELGAILIKNPGFEKDKLAKEGASSWHYGVKDWSGDKGGVVNISSPNSTMFPGKQPPEGENMAFLAFPGSYISQILEHRLAPSRQYKLSVVIGHRAESAFGDGEYEIELYAGNNLLTQQRGSIPESGEFQELNIDYMADHHDLATGGALKLVLKNINARQINFDNVRMSSQLR